MHAKLIVSAMAAVLVAACSRSDDKAAAEAAAKAAQASQQAAQSSQSAAQSAQQGAQSIAQGLQQLAQGVQQTGADGKPVPPVEFEKLEALLPSPSGWEKGKPDSQQQSGAFSISTTEVDYKKGEADVNLVITDAAFNNMVTMPFTFLMAMGYNQRSSDGYEKSAETAGFPGFEKWQNDGKRGEVMALVGKRFIVQAKGHNVDNIATIRAFVEQVDLPKLAALK